MTKVVVIGASENPERYSYKATMALKKYGYEAVPVGLRNGQIGGTDIITNLNLIPDVHTITLYVGPHNQPYWYKYITDLKPKRVIFNPGTENTELMNLLKKQGIEVVVACTLVMLAAKAF